jgi:hypothetical protein
MKPLNLLCRRCCQVMLILFICGGNGLFAQEKDQPEPVKKYVTLRYFNENNSNQYLLLSAIAKTSTGVIPQEHVTFSVFMDEQSDAHLVGKSVTDKEGLAKFFIPPSLRDQWDSLDRHNFIAIANPGTKDEQTQETAIQKSQISIDTLNEDGVRSLVAHVSKRENGEWIPVPDVDVKLGVKRLGGVVLSGGDEPTYSTDDSGDVKMEFTRVNLPGDPKGNLILAAKVEDNDELGNLLVIKTAPWGIPEKIETNFFDQRTLWSTRFRTPYWLLIIAYSIVLSVWGTLIYLVLQLVKIKRIGKRAG